VLAHEPLMEARRRQKEALERRRAVHGQRVIARPVHRHAHQRLLSLLARGGGSDVDGQASGAGGKKTSLRC
jgi:hypothetical protein